MVGSIPTGTLFHFPFLILSCGLSKPKNLWTEHIARWWVVEFQERNCKSSSPPLQLWLLPNTEPWWTEPGEIHHTHLVQPGISYTSRVSPVTQVMCTERLKRYFVPPLPPTQTPKFLQENG